MRPTRVVTGRGVPLDRADVDTDTILPNAWLKRVERTGFGEGLFAAWREDPDFVLNQPRYDGAKILVTGPNFGIGSSREHAVWALTDYGFDAVVSARFSDIFRNNATKSGLVPVEVPPNEASRLLRAIQLQPGLELTVDVERRVLAAPALGLVVEFPLDDFTRHRFLHGLDDAGLTLRHEQKIARFESGRAAWLPITVNPSEPRREGAVR